MVTYKEMKTQKDGGMKEGEKKIKILIAEDEKPMAKALELKLNASGYEAKAVGNGREALEEMAKADYSILLLDIMMPEVDGFGVLSELKNKNNKAKVIMLSNLAQEEDMKKAKDLGAIGYFVKSDTPIAQIVEEVKKALIK